MEEKLDTILGHLSEINVKKDMIRKGIALSRQTYAAYMKKRRRILTIRISLATMGMAAAILLGITFIPSFIRLSPETLFDKNYQRFVFETNDRGLENPKGLTAAADLYMIGRNKEALVILDSIRFDDSDIVRAQFIMGLTEMDLGNYPLAAGQLKEVANSGGVIGNAAAWYLSLLYIKQMEYKQAGSWLKAVKTFKGSPYSERAAKLYHRIRFRATK